MNSECTRCHKYPVQTFFINQKPSVTFGQAGADWDMVKPPTYEASCADCLKDTELLALISPVTLYAIEQLINHNHPGALRDALARVHAEICFRHGPHRFSPSELREKAQRVVGELAK